MECEYAHQMFCQNGDYSLFASHICIVTLISVAFDSMISRFKYYTHMYIYAVHRSMKFKVIVSNMCYLVGIFYLVLHFFYIYVNNP